MYRKVALYINEHGMLDNCDCVVAGLSGGADSVALVHILNKICRERGIELVAVHVHHGIRGSEADGDMLFCKELCSRLNVKFREFAYDVPEYAKRNRLTCEEAGRILRYNSLRQVAAEYGSARIAVAHHMNDQAETVIFNVARGSGIRGLRGMLPVNGTTIRPLLCCTRDEIEDYIEETGLDFRTDSTNDCDDYARNIIRHKAIPSMEKVNSAAVRNIAKAAERCTEAEEYLEKETGKLYVRLKKNMDDKIYLKIDGSIHPYMVKRLIRRTISDMAGLKDVTSDQIKKVVALINSDCGKKSDISGGIWAERASEGILFYREHGGNSFCMELKAPMITVLPDGRGNISLDVEAWSSRQKILSEVYTKQFDYDKIENGLCLRTRRDEDYLVIDGQGHRKKLNQYFINAKVPAAVRDDVLLLADGNHIIWVIGMRISDYYKISGTTRTILKVQYGGTTDGES